MCEFVQRESKPRRSAVRATVRTDSRLGPKGFGSVTPIRIGLTPAHRRYANGRFGAVLRAELHTRVGEVPSDRVPA